MFKCCKMGNATSQMLVSKSVRSAVTSKSSLRLFSTSQVEYYRTASDNIDRRFNSERKKRNPWRVERWYKPNLLEINKLQDRVAFDQENRYGAETVPRRSDFIEWNYDAEISAFQARIGEQFDAQKLRQAFVTKEYLESEIQSKKSLGFTDDNNEDESSTSSDSDSDEVKQLSQSELEQVRTSSNSELAMSGDDILEDVVASYTRTALPNLPEEGVEAVTNYLTTDEKLAHVSFHLGTMDLILSKEYPPRVDTMADTFRALIAALWQTNGGNQARTKKLIVDVLATQLHGVDILEVWDVSDPIEITARICRNLGMADPEARLIWSSGKGTIMACYHVGFYSGEELIGQGPGESPEIAEEEAARDVLRRLFSCEHGTSSPLPFTSKKLGGSNFKETPNARLEDWKPSKVENVTVV